MSKPTKSVSQAEYDKLLAENIALKAKAAGPKPTQPLVKGVTCRITDKGGLSVYGMGRFPVTLYKRQWETLLSAQAEIKAFIKANPKITDKEEVEDDAE